MTAKGNNMRLQLFAWYVELLWCPPDRSELRVARCLCPRPRKLQRSFGGARLEHLEAEVYFANGQSDKGKYGG